MDGRLMTTPKLIGIPPHVATLTSADESCNLGRLRRLTVWLCRNANKWLARAGETGAGVVGHGSSLLTCLVGRWSPLLDITFSPPP